jgi:ankyrin repeat and SOCS box protein 17
MILLRHGANPDPLDGGTSPVLAVMDKLMEYEESGSFPYQLVSCFKILLLALPFIELPYKVQKKMQFHPNKISISFNFQPLLFEARKEMFLRKYAALFQQKLIPLRSTFGVPELKHLSRFCCFRTKSTFRIFYSNYLFRCAVREELRKNFQLPNGITSLKIPKALKRYVDLMQE